MIASKLIFFVLGLSLGVHIPTVNSVQQSDVQFYMYSPESPNTMTVLVTGQLDVNLDNTRNFKFIIHGYTDYANKTWVLQMKDSYLRRGPYYVIAVDWSDIASGEYSHVAADTPDVGKYVALFIADLHNTLGVSYDSVHLVGHSLGAHVSGFAGQYLLSTVNEKIARITGMDPAGPLFVGTSEDKRLSRGDAYFVDIIHTDGYKLGFHDTCGDIDFYPNGGIAVQPGCAQQTIEEHLAACSHVRSYMYFNESINSLGFVANKCDNYDSYMLGSCLDNEQAIMGENVDVTQTGVFYLTTNPAPLYARNGQI